MNLMVTGFAVDVKRQVRTAYQGFSLYFSMLELGEFRQIPIRVLIWSGPVRASAGLTVF